jgi:hypothetical protein
MVYFVICQGGTSHVCWVVYVDQVKWKRVWLLLHFLLHRQRMELSTRPSERIWFHFFINICACSYLKILRFHPLAYTASWFDCESDMKEYDWQSSNHSAPHWTNDLALLIVTGYSIYLISLEQIKDTASLSVWITVKLCVKWSSQIRYFYTENLKILFIKCI